MSYRHSGQYLARLPACAGKLRELAECVVSVAPDLAGRASEAACQPASALCADAAALAVGCSSTVRQLPTAPGTLLTGACCLAAHDDVVWLSNLTRRTAPQDLWQRPICSAPGAWVEVMERERVISW